LVYQPFRGWEVKFDFELDRQHRALFFQAVEKQSPGSLAGEIRRWVVEQLDPLVKQTPHYLLSGFNFLGVMYVMGFIGFEDYVALRSPSGLSARASEAIRDRLKEFLDPGQDRTKHWLNWASQYESLTLRPGPMPSHWLKILSQPDLEPWISDPQIADQLPFYVVAFGSRHPARITSLSSLFVVGLSYPHLPLRNTLVMKRSQIDLAATNVYSQVEWLASQMMFSEGAVVPFGFMRMREYGLGMDLKFMPMIPQARTLGDYSKHASLDESLSSWISLVDTLIYGAKAGVLHNDLKGNNILVDRKRRVFVIDYGAATFVDPTPWLLPARTAVVISDAIRDTYNHEIDLVKVRVGYAPYLPPEVKLGAMKDHSQFSQVYLVGKLVEEFVSQIPVQEDTQEALQQLARLVAHCQRPLARDRPTLLRLKERLEQIQSQLRSILPGPP
jgi:hypothetical protein